MRRNKLGRPVMQVSRQLVKPQLVDPATKISLPTKKQPTGTKILIVIRSPAHPINGVQIPPKGPNPVTMVIKSTSTECNFALTYNASISNNKQAWKSIIQDNNLIFLTNAETIFNTKGVTRAVHHAVSYSGATRHFLVEGVPVKNKEIESNPIRIKLPNVNYIQSTCTWNLYISWLPETMKEAHIVSGLSYSSLISPGKFCDAGCTVFFDEYKCRVYFKGELLLLGERDETTELWRLPIKSIYSQNHKNKYNQLVASLDLQLTP